MSFQPLRLDALIRDMITRVRARYPNLEVIFRSESSKIIQGDNTRLAQVFENLFSNALKYAPQSRIEITIKAINSSSIQVVFADNGDGIPAEHLPYIFDRFYRVPDHPGKTGTGLGLFICKRIIDVHHGKIWAESKKQKGTQFIIELPTQ
ncbi:MAG: HAMP domain-containing histidine kinase [Anaerolineales bacterium]|nr:HAMP domain-containing histidine kinase [Anaerolineales bacterium]